MSEGFHTYNISDFSGIDTFFCMLKAFVKAPHERQLQFHTGILCSINHVPAPVEVDLNIADLNVGT